MESSSESSMSEDTIDRSPRYSIFAPLDIDFSTFGTFITEKEEKAVEKKLPARPKLQPLKYTFEKVIEQKEEENKELSSGEKIPEKMTISESMESVDVVDMVPSETNAILENIQQSMEDRRKAEIKEQLDRIIDRVEITLLHAGDTTVIPRDADEAVEMFSKIETGPEFSLEEKKAELQFKQQMMTKILGYAKSQEERKTIMTEINDWLNASDDVERDCISEEQWESREQALHDIEDQVAEAFANTDESVGKIQAMGHRLLVEAGYIDPDEEDGVKKPRKMKPFEMEDVIPEKELNETENLQTAMKEVKMILDQAIRFVRMQQHKNVLRAGIKQYKFIMKNISQRVENHDILTAEMDNFKQEFETLTAAADHYKDEVANDKEKIVDLHDQLATMDTRVRDLIAENSELQSIVAQLESYKDQTISSISEEAMRSPSETTTKQSIKTVIDGTTSSSSVATRSKSKSTAVASTASKQESFKTQSMISASTKSLQEELEVTKKELDDTKKSLDTAEQHLNFAYEEIEQLNAKLGMMDEFSGKTSDIQTKLKEDALASLKTIRNERDSYEKQVACLLTELSCKNELIEYQENRMADMKDELGIIDIKDVQSFSGLQTKDGKPLPDDVKNMLVHMKKGMNSETDRLRKHLEKEKSRHEAAMRKQEKKHREDLTNIHKTSLHLLRAVNRFKEQMAALLDRENLPLGAAEIRRIQNLPTEDVPADVKMLLTQMAGSAVELLVNVEFKLSQALMNKRLEVKERGIAKNFAAKDLETQMEAAQRAKKAAENMAGTMKEMKRKLMAAEEAISEMRQMEDDRYKGLAERYRKLMYQYTTLQKENAKMELEAKKNLKNKKKELHQMASAKNSMAQLVEDQKGMITNMHKLATMKKDKNSLDMQLSIVDQKQNLDILQKALKENKISKEMYTMTVDLIKKSMDLPLLKLRSLFKKYISYRRLQDAKAYIRQQFKKEATGHRKAELEEYIANMDSKLERDNEVWQKEMAKLELKRKNMFGEMNEVFTDVIVQTGVMLLVPEDKLLTIPSAHSELTAKSVFTSSSDGEKRPGGKYSKLPGIMRKSPLLEMPAEVVGRSFSRGLPDGEDSEPVWKVNTTRVLPPIKKNWVETPKILEYDIQQQLKAAQRALAGIHYRSKYPIGTVSGFDYSFDKVTPLSMLSDTGYGDSDSGSLDTASHYTSVSEGRDSAIDNTMVNIRVDIKVKDHHYVAGTNYNK